MRLTTAVLAVLLIAGKAMAADLTVSVRSPPGEPIANAVVTVETAQAPALSQARLGWPSEMVQHDLQFDPFVLVAPVGATVSFPNQDKVRHHVYSFSPTKRFELKLYGKGETRSVTFEKAGVVAVGCNIHDGMVGFIKVVNTPYAAKTPLSGDAVIRNIPAGPVTIRVWHPYMRGPEAAATASLPAAGAVRRQMNLTVRVPAHVHQSY
jgi:plastocyanin